MDQTDEDGDSTMHSSPEDQEDDLFPAHDAPSTPKLTQTSSELSPPASRGRNVPPVAASNTSATLDHGASGSGSAAATTASGTDRAEAGRTAGAGGKKAGPAQSHTHAASGYTWHRDEDGPGWAWRNKKAQEENVRSWDNVVDKDRMIRTAYGDPLALQASGT